MFEAQAMAIHRRRPPEERLDFGDCRLESRAGMATKNCPLPATSNSPTSVSLLSFAQIEPEVGLGSHDLLCRLRTVFICVYTSLHLSGELPNVAPNARDRVVQACVHGSLPCAMIRSVPTVPGGVGLSENRAYAPRYDGVPWIALPLA
jgi:hypothetical protein